MMKRRKLIAWGGLIFCSVLHAETSSGSEPTLAGETRTPVKHGIQVVIRADGSVIERLALPNYASVASQKNASKQTILPTSPEEWLARMIDPTKNGLAAKNPELFAEWLDAVTEPRFMTALATVALTPDTYSKTFGKMVDPATVRNWAEFADPRIGLRWMIAGLDPHFYQAIFNRMTDSSKLRRWGLSAVGHDAASLADSATPVATDRPIPAARAQTWLQLPTRETKTNPWLTNSLNYRY
jgi:hypothetical protein